MPGCANLPSAPSYRVRPVVAVRVDSLTEIYSYLAMKRGPAGSMSGDRPKIAGERLIEFASADQSEHRLVRAVY
jgi:hypothetical protein